MKKKYVAKNAWCIYFLLVVILLPIQTTAAIDPTQPILSLSIENKVVTIHVRDVSLDEILLLMNEQTNISFGYQEGVIDKNQKFSLDVSGVPVEEALRILFKNSNYDFEYKDQRILIVLKSIPKTEAKKDRTVKGVVLDQSGTPLPGTTVLLKGTTLGVATDVNGSYSLQIPQGNQTLVFSLVGMKTQEIPYKGQIEINVTMEEDITEMDEVVVTGYSVRKVNELTGAAQQFHGKEVAQNMVNGDILSALKGHTTGLQISGSDGNPARNNSLLLRGVGTLYDSKQYPLIVIDGIVTDFTNINGVVAANDIEEITVLKDAASSAIYGSRAAMGVIVITTKKGQKSRQTTSVDMKFGLSVQNFGGLRYMTSEELLDYGKMSLTNWWNGNNSLQAKYPDRDGFIRDTLSSLSQNFNLSHTTDWRDLQYQHGITKSIGVNISGGSERASYYLSYNYFDEKGTKIDNYLTRNFLKLRMDYDVTPFLTLGINLSGTFSKYESPNSGSFEDYHPWLSPYDEDGKLKKSIPQWRRFAMYNVDLVNPLMDNQYNSSISHNDNLMGSFSGTLHPFSWMSFTSVNTYTRIYSNTNNYQDSRTYSGNYSNNNFSNGILDISDARDDSFLTSNILRMEYRFNDHNISGLLGQEYYERHSRSSNLSMYDQSVVGERNVGGFSKVGKKIQSSYVPDGSESESGSFSLFAEANYNYKGKYMASVSFRTDASTNFGKDNRYGKFYSISGAWLVSSEKFMQKQKALSFLKLRLSYGTSGKEAGIDYLNYTLYAIGKDYEDYYREHPLYPSSYPAVINQLGNDQLTWETAYTFNLGLDMGFLNDRIRLNTDYYRRRNSDLIMSVATAAAIGVGAQYKNVGEMLNQGVELTLNTHTLKSSDFNWYTTFTFSHNKNELTKLYDGYFVDGEGRTFYEGDNIDMLKKVKVNGVDKETGKPIYERVNEDG
ncbi:SusC/RagA family TonB-linked outer membrane protein, partial [Butyricimonas paravirosa]